MYRNPVTGSWEHDFQGKDMPRLHVSYGKVKRAVADRLHSAVSAAYQAKQRDVIDAYKAGTVSAGQLAELRDAHRPFSDALTAHLTNTPWPVVTDAIRLYVEGIAANDNRKDATEATASSQLNRFLGFIVARGLAGARLDAITSVMVEDYQAWLIAAEAKPNTVTAYVARVGSMFHWFAKREQRAAREAKRPARELHIPIDPDTITRTKTARVRFLAEPEAERLLTATPAQFLFPVAVGLFAGLRVDEMAHLRTHFDVDLELGLLSVQVQPHWSPKTKRSIRHVPIAGVLRPILERHLERFASDDWVVPSFRNPLKPLHAKAFSTRFNRIADDAELVSGRADPEGVTYHTTRHTFASWLLMRGTDVFTVAKLLGNTVKQVEDTYGHLARDFRQAAVDTLSGAVRLPDLSEDFSTANTTTEPV